MKQVIFVIPPTTQILDLAGPLQAFSEAKGLGADYQIRFAGVAPQAPSAQGLLLAGLEHYSELQVTANDLILIAGISSQNLSEAQLLSLGAEFYAWLRRCYQQGAILCSICNGAFFLAQSGLLNGRKCTTHWSRTKELARRFPHICVVENRLFMKDQRLYTSAGICSGLDLALSIIEDDYGPRFTAKLAHMLVVYIRRDGEHSQQSVYLDYRAHLNPAIHKVQDQLTQYPERQHTIEILAQKVHMSPRNLTRQFKRETGVTIKTFVTLVRMEKAATLLHNPELSIDAIGVACGFQNPRQFRRLWRKFRGCSPSESRPLPKDSRL